MSETGLPLQTILKIVREIAPESLARSWDNVGLLIEPTEPVMVSRVFFVKDLTEVTLAEAIERQANLILTYRPPISSPLRKITTNSWREKIIAKLFEKKIALYSYHTCIDAASDGLNDLLLTLFYVTEKTYPIIPDKNDPTVGQGRMVTRNTAMTLAQAIDLMKKKSQLTHLRVAKGIRDVDEIKTIAVCVGTGASVLKQVPADLYITGEMGHQEVLEAIHNGTNVFLLGQGTSEQNFIGLITGHLFNRLIFIPGGRDIVMLPSIKDGDPLRFV